MANVKPLLWIILDGFGVSVDPAGNPVAEAKKPTFDMLERNFPFTTLQASGSAVGLPWGEAGNSEVGHFTMGSGRVIYHHLPRIINAVYDGSFFANELFVKAAAHVREQKSRFHIAGLVSSGSVHSYVDHLYAFLDFTKRENLSEVYLHLFSDGKDAPPKEGAKFYAMLAERLQNEWPHVHISTVNGRFYSLDRDEKWDRIQAAYELLTHGTGEKITSVPDYMEKSYAQDIMDEFIKPAIVVDAQGNDIGRIQKNDALVFTDFREDSMREITHAFVDDAFDKFPREKVENLFVVTMTEYDKTLRAYAAFTQLDINWPFSRVIGEAGLRHLHIAETQKYAHVTYFFNGGKETPFPGEERILVQSVNVAHFDEAPEMKSAEIAAKILENFETYDVIIANFANADMVGHSGNFQAATKAVEALDAALAQLVHVVLAHPQAAMIVTADHGNIELKRNAISGEKLTEHSINPIPLFLVGTQFQLKTPRTDEGVRAQKSQVGGILTDIAPTALDLLGIKKPAEMTGESLLSQLEKEK